MRNRPGYGGLACKVKNLLLDSVWKCRATFSRRLDIECGLQIEL